MFLIKEQRAIVGLIIIIGTLYTYSFAAQEAINSASQEQKKEAFKDSSVNQPEKVVKQEDCSLSDLAKNNSGASADGELKDTTLSAKTEKNSSKKSAKKPIKKSRNKVAGLQKEPVVVAKEPEKPKRKLQDKMVALVHGPVRSQIFCESDQQRRGIDGRQRSLEENIVEELGYQKIKEMNAPMDDTMVKEHLTRTVQSFGLKPGDETQIFAQEGYSYAEGFDKFRLMYANNMWTEYFIKQKIMVCEDEVIAYYNANPIEKEPKYELKMAFVPVDREKGQKARGIEQDIERYVKTGSGIDVKWSEPSWLQESDLAESLDFIPEMQQGEIKKQKVIGGFQLYQLQSKKPKRLVSLKKRYRDIVESLRKPKFETTYQKHQKSLFDNATIVHI